MQEVMHDIDVKLLRIFRVVAERKGFSSAAEQLNTSLSNISINMSQLESRLQMRLCERGAKGFKLTDQGKRILAASEELYEAMHKFQVQVEAVSEATQREFRIGILSEKIVEREIRIPEILADLEKTFPGSTFYLEFGPSVALRKRVDAGDLHCAFSYFAGEFPESTSSRFLYSERHFCYCGKKHELFSIPDDEISSSTLRNVRIAGYDDMEDDEKMVVPLFSKYDSCSRSCEGILALILTGDYIGLLAESFAKNWIDSGLIRPIVKKELELSVDIEVIYKSSRADEPAITSLLASINKFYPSSAEARS